MEWKEPAIKNRISKRLWIALVSICLLLMLVYAVMFIWNTVLPDLIHVSSMNYLQAAGLFILCRLLFGRLYMGRRGAIGFTWDKRRDYSWKDKFSHMNMEEKDAFKHQWRSHCEKKSQIEKKDVGM